MCKKSLSFAEIVVKREIAISLGFHSGISKSVKLLKFRQFSPLMIISLD